MSERGVLAAYDAAGRTVASPLSGIPGGSIVDVRRAFNNVDPALDCDPANQNQ